MQAVSTEHIEISSNIRGGKPCIVGRRIAVEDVAVMHLTYAVYRWIDILFFTEFWKMALKFSSSINTRRDLPYIFEDQES